MTQPSPHGDLPPQSPRNFSTTWGEPPSQQTDHWGATPSATPATTATAFTTPTSPTGLENKPSKTARIPLLIVGVLLVVGATGFGLWTYTSSDTEPTDPSPAESSEAESSEATAAPEPTPSTASTTTSTSSTPQANDGLPFYAVSKISSEELARKVVNEGFTMCPRANSTFSSNTVSKFGQLFTAEDNERSWMAHWQSIKDHSDEWLELSEKNKFGCTRKLVADAKTIESKQTGENSMWHKFRVNMALEQLDNDRVVSSEDMTPFEVVVETTRDDWLYQIENMQVQYEAPLPIH